MAQAGMSSSKARGGSTKGRMSAYRAVLIKREAIPCAHLIPKSRLLRIGNVERVFRMPRLTKP